MLSNKKSILVYGLNNNQIEYLRSTGNKLIIITNEMIGMRVKDIISGLKFQVATSISFDEKIILFNNFPDDELRGMISVVKSVVENPILAMVTPTSYEWEVKFLIEHLIEEREWHRKR